MTYDKLKKKVSGLILEAGEEGSGTQLQSRPNGFLKFATTFFRRLNSFRILFLLTNATDLKFLFWLSSKFNGINATILSSLILVHSTIFNQD